MMTIRQMLSKLEIAAEQLDAAGSDSDLRRAIIAIGHVAEVLHQVVEQQSELERRLDSKIKADKRRAFDEALPDW